MGLDKIKLLSPSPPCQEFLDELNLEFRLRSDQRKMFHFGRVRDPYSRAGASVDTVHPHTEVAVWTIKGYEPQFRVELQLITPGGKQPPLTTIETNPNKLEHGWHDLKKLVHRVFGADCPDLKVSRLDLNAEIEGYPVDYFRDALRIPLKRKSSDVGRSDELQGVLAVGRVWKKRGFETVEFGKRPAFVRVYNKIAEMKYRREDVTPFPDVLTRLEWELHGARIPGVTGLGKAVVDPITGKNNPPALLFSELPNLLDVQPFAKIQLLSGFEMESFDWENDYQGSERRLVMKGLIDRYGYQSARSILNLNRNFKRDYQDLIVDNVELKTRIEDSYAKTTQLFFEGKGADVRFLYPVPPTNN